MEKLLNPQDVASLLNISLQTVYDNQKRLGGFFPAGIRVLRFREEVIRGYMEGQNNRDVQIQVRVPRQAIRRRRVQDQSGSPNSAGRSAEGGSIGGGCLSTGNPDDPYGVRALARSLSSAKRKAPRPKDGEI